MRNFALLQDGEKAWAQPSPLWEQKEVKIEQSTEIPIPNNQAEMLTLQSRRIILKRENDRVTGHVLLGGDYISSENAFAEQMTIWRQATKRDLLAYYPKQHDATKQMWREFPTFFEGRSPGVLRWNVLLQKSGALDRKEAITLWVVSNQYDSQQASLKDTFSDALSLHLAAFAELGFKRKIVVSEIHRCEQFADALGKLANDLALAAGGSEQDVSRSAKEQFYFRIDQPFRRWLYSIDPDWDEDETDASLAAWLEQAKKIVYAMGNQLVEEAGPAAFVGRMVKKKEGKKETSYRCAAPIASNKFASRISMIEKKGGA